MSQPDVIPIRLPDQAARDRISGDLDTNLLVEAGAGSGKTTALVDRMVSLVASGCATVEQIAAVTFTRKSAGELRERFQIVLERSVRAAREQGADSVERERLEAALEDIDRAFIGTIHSFCARLLRERPLEVGLDPAFQELGVEERMLLRRRFWDAHLEGLTRDSDPLLVGLASAGLRPSSLFGLFGHLVENPDVEFPADESTPPTEAEIAPIRSALETLVDHGWVLIPDREPQPEWDSLQKKFRTLHFTRDVTGWREPAALFDALALLRKHGTSRHKVTQKRWKDGALAKAFCERVNAFAAGDTAAGRLLDRWLAHRYSLAIRLADRAAKAFAEHRLRAGRLDFQDLLVLTARLLRTHTGARRQLGQRYRRLLVDEFQDTDPLQAEIMFLLASEPGEVDGDWSELTPRPGGLFVVGDPKQSIYRFRRADIQLYARAKARIAAIGAVLELNANFRSKPRIGDLVNELFVGEGFFPDEATAEQAAFEPLNTRPSEPTGRAEGVFVYDVAPSATNRSAVAEDDAARLASWIRRRVDAGERGPGDFMILTRTRGKLETYARALEERGLPVQVTGAGVGAEEELRELAILLECMVDPSNPVRVVAVLVGLFYGLDYDRLVDHRLAGGVFDAVRPGTAGDPDVLAALEDLHRTWRRSVAEPADVFVTGLASTLGLAPYAAAGELGSLRTGALVYALDAVRAATLSGEASLPGALTAIAAALDLTEAEAPLEPGRPDVVRLMNLHQAKGLEAPVVVLAEPTGAVRRTPDLHIRRGAHGHALGYLKVTEASSGWGGDRVLALPEGWESKQEIEGRFEDAEEVRLLYVAVTRAREELVVARWPTKPDASPWAPLRPWLEDGAQTLELEPVRPEVPARLDPAWVEEALAAEAEAAEALRRASVATLRRETVTGVAKSDESFERRASRPNQGSPDPDEFRGFSWGSAVHGALAAAADAPDPEALRAACRDLLVELGRPVDDHGQPLELVELVDLVGAVTRSPLWDRARAAEHLLAEAAFALPLPPTSVGAVAAASPERSPTSARGRRQLDLFGTESVETDESSVDAPASAEGAEAQRILEGVVDLAFKEADGWVIVDYKTDLGTDPGFPSRRASYVRQVDLYADAWSRLTREPVKERILFFTAQDRIHSW